MSDDEIKAFGHDDDETEEVEVPVDPELLEDTDEVVSLDELGDEEDLDADPFDDVDEM